MMPRVRRVNAQLPIPDFQSRRRLRASSLALCLLTGGLGVPGVGTWEMAVPVAAQDMPDPSLIHGRAIPAPELPNGTVTVRVVRQAIGNNVAGQQVRVTVGGTTRTATTDELGRAEFTDLPQGGDARAEATVDGEPLVSQPFPVPASGGLRVILVAGMARAAEQRAREEAEAAAAPAVKGTVVLGGNTRILMEFNDDVLRAFYVLEIVNSARSRVDTGGPLIIDLPEAIGAASVLEGSSPSASASGNRVTIMGPFASGTTTVQVGFQLRYSGSERTVVQTWPVPLQQVIVAVEKVGGAAMSSQQFAATSDVRTDDGTVFVLGNGPALPAGTPLTVRLSNLPARSAVPRYVALGLALTIAGFGTWLAVTARSTHGQQRQALLKRRDTLLGELAQLESRRRAGAMAPERYATRRERIVTELEQLYGELDEASAGPQGGGEGVAA
jgi:hypothetical protein